MKDKLNVVKYDAGLQKLALFFHSGNTYLDYFLREGISLDANFGKTYVFLSQRSGFEDLEDDMKFSVEDSDVECKSMYLPIEII